MGRELAQLGVVRGQLGFDEVCAGVGEGGEVLGVRVFGDCDHVMKELMKLLSSDVEREKWEEIVVHVYLHVATACDNMIGRGPMPHPSPLDPQRRLNSYQF